MGQFMSIKVVLPFKTLFAIVTFIFLIICMSAHMSLITTFMLKGFVTNFTDKLHTFLYRNKNVQGLSSLLGSFFWLQHHQLCSTSELILFFILYTPCLICLCRFKLEGEANILEHTSHS